MIFFEENATINTQNPDRGFYDADYALNELKSYNMFQTPKEDGFNLVYAPIDLSDYNETLSLPQSLIEIIDKNLLYAEESEVKLIFRIKYRSSIENSYDPSLNIIISHLNQLKETLQNHKEIISIVQAGTIGAWGEWHSFSGDFANDNEVYLENRKAIIEKLMDIFPNKYIQIRTPMHKEQLFGSSNEYADESSDAKITSNIAYSDDVRAKIGHHNDCFLASATDMGTYPSDNVVFWQDYVVNDSKYAPLGGETCKDEETYTNCLNATTQLKKLQYSYINNAYHPDVIQRWKDEGCYQEIRQNIGYRLVASELETSQSNDTLTLSLSITNKGYAAPYIESEINFILKNENNYYEFSQTDVDLRTFYPNELKKLNEDLSLLGIVNGEYCLYLQIGKSFSSIRLSNSNLWDENNLMNKLACNVIVK